MHQYPTEVERRQLEILQTREKIWGRLYEDRSADERNQQSALRQEHTTLVSIETARTELQKHLPRAIIQASSALARAHQLSWQDKHVERQFLGDDQKGPIYQLDILRSAGAAYGPVAITANQTALERVREINIGVTTSLKLLPERSLQNALGSYGQQTSRARSIPFAKSLEFVRDYIPKAHNAALPAPINAEKNITR